MDGMRWYGMTSSAMCVLHMHAHNLYVHPQKSTPSTQNTMAPMCMWPPLYMHLYTHIPPINTHLYFRAPVVAVSFKRLLVPHHS